MDILVTGASGFLGSYVCHQLSAWANVRALVRENSDLSRLKAIKDNITVQAADLLDMPELSRVFATPDVVIHCAAKVSFASADRDELLETNVEGTRNIVNLCLVNGTNQLVHISSTAAIGRSKLEEHLDESTKWTESPFTSCYGRSKYMAELEVWRGESEGLNVTILNPSIILGRNTQGSGSGRLFDYVRDGKRHYPSGHANVVDVRDVAEIVERAIRGKVTGQRFILNGTNVPYRLLFSKIAGELNKKAPDVEVSGWKLTFALWWDSLRAAMTSSRRYLSKEIIRNSSSRVTFSTRRAVKTFKFKFRTLEESITWIIKEP